MKPQSLTFYSLEKNIISTFSRIQKRYTRTMFFPIGDQNIKGKGMPVANITIMAINIIVFMVIELPIFYQSEALADTFFKNWGAQPCHILQFEKMYTLLTSMFLHGSLLHIIGNMFFLYIFGDNIEQTIGRSNYVLFYILGGIFAAYTFAIFEGNTACMPMVGASGAIAAVMGAYLAMYPRSQIRLLIVIFTVSVPAWAFLAFWGGQELFTSLRGISLIEEVGDQVAHWAHAGGFIFGLLAGLYFKNRYKLLALS